MKKMKIKFNVKIIVALLVTVALTIALISALSNYYIRENFSIFCEHYGHEIPQCLRDSAGQSFLKSIQQSLLVAGAVGILFSFLLGTFITKILLKPIKEIIKVSSSFSSGKYSERITIKTNDEFSDLIEVENKLFENVENQEILRKDLVANFSHEIATPLTNIYGYIQALQEGVIKGEKEKERVLSLIKRETERLIKLSNETKNLALLESDNAQYNIKGVNLGKLIEEVVDLFKPKADKKDVKIKIEKEDLRVSKILVKVDRDKIKQAIGNILDNAIRYSPKNSVVKIGVKLESDFVSISITDKGVGIAKEELRNVFERFYKIRSSKTKSEGTGIGLTIAKKIVEAHDGEIGIISKLGKGTTVNIQLPVNV
jgi:two-component system, OmpR family, sensor histidine kinase BaeS